MELNQTPRGMYDTLGRLTEADPQMTIQSLRTFLLVAMNEGASLKELADRIGLPQASTGRYLQDLSDSGRLMAGKRKASMGLVRSEVDPNEMRRKMFTLTPKGRKFLADLLG